MPKIRGIKPETWTDDKFVRLSPLARLLFIGMWNLACDNGHVEDNHIQLKIRLLPMDQCDIGELLDEMIATGQVERHDGFLKVVKLPEHQKIDLYWLTLCEWCEQDEDTTFATADKRSRKKGSSQSQDGDKSGASLLPVSDVRGGDVRGGDVRGDARGDDKPATKSRAKPSTGLPDDFRPTDKHLELAQSLGVDLRAEWPKFCDHHIAKGSTMKDWNAALRTWIRNGPKFSNVRHLPPAEDTSWMRRTL